MQLSLNSNAICNDKHQSIDDKQTEAHAGARSLTEIKGTTNVRQQKCSNSNNNNTAAATATTTTTTTTTTACQGVQGMQRKRRRLAKTIGSSTSLLPTAITKTSAALIFAASGEFYSRLVGCHATHCSFCKIR